MSYKPYAAIIAAAQAANTGIKFDMLNNSGSLINALQPVTSDGSGQVKAIDPSVEDDSLKVVGVAAQMIPDGSSGSVVSHGKFENISTSFSFGDYVYVSKTGDLTNILPTIGSNGFTDGDFVIRVGVIVKNKTIPSQKDLVVQINIVGQL